MNHLFRLSAGLLRSGTAGLYRRGPVPEGHVSLVVARLFSSEPENSELGQLIKKDKVVVFIKGTPAQPMCGFSNAVVQILRMHGVDDYASYNVLEDQDLRQGVKNFSNWPTIPQVYFNGEFVGGCDILLQMHQNGDLVEELKKLGIHSALLDANKDEQKKVEDTEWKESANITFCEYVHGFPNIILFQQCLIQSLKKPNTAGITLESEHQSAVSAHCHSTLATKLDEATHTRLLATFLCTFGLSGLLHCS